MEPDNLVSGDMDKIIRGDNDATEPDQPLTEEEKQKIPMPGKISPKDAAVKAREFAAQEIAKLRKK